MDLCDLSLSERCALLLLDGMQSTHRSVAKTHRLHCIASAIFWELYEDGLLAEAHGCYSLSAKETVQSVPLAQVICSVFSGARPASLRKWMDRIERMNLSALKKLEQAAVSRLKDAGVLDERGSLLECDMMYATADVAIPVYRADNEQYHYEADRIKSELLEPGEPDEEALFTLWVLEQAHMPGDCFSTSEMEALQKQKNRLFLENRLYKTLSCLRLKHSLSAAYLAFLRAKDAFARTKFGTGIVFAFPMLQKKDSIFIDSGQYFEKSGNRLADTVGYLEGRGHICHIKRMGACPLVEIDNRLYELIPTAVVIKVPIHGVRLRPYVM